MITPEDGFTFTITCEACPTQAEGMYRNRPWYFRFRHCKYSLVIGNVGDNWKNGIWVNHAMTIANGTIGIHVSGCTTCAGMLYETTVRDIVETALCAIP